MDPDTPVTGRISSLLPPSDAAHTDRGDDTVPPHDLVDRDADDPWGEIEAEDPCADYPWPSGIIPCPRRLFGLYEQDPYIRLYVGPDNIERVAVTDGIAPDLLVSRLFLPLTWLMVVRQQHFLVFKSRWPLLERDLPDKYNPKNVPEPVEMHFGIAISDYHLVAFAEEVGAKVCFRNRPTRVCYSATRVKVVEVLGRICKWPNFKLETPTASIRPDMMIVVSFYTNYELENSKLSPDDEDRIVKQIQKLFKLNEEYKPLWFFEYGQWIPGMPE